MSEFETTISTVEEYIEHLIKAAEIGAGNVPLLEELDKKEYKAAVEKIDYWRYIQSADYHYFVSRLLFLHHIIEYSNFCGHQCIENYLKAYLKYMKIVPPNWHSLKKLAERARDVSAEADDFISSDRLSVIIAKYEPFYELARYPVQKKRPKSGYAFIYPYDIYILDYFVLKMRQMLSIPDNTWDILKDGHYKLEQSKRNTPDFYKLIFANNINFGD